MSVLEIAQRATRTLGPSGYEHDGRTVVSADKVRSESALLLLATADACRADEALRAHHAKLADTLVPFARTEEVAVRIALEPKSALELALPHLALRRAGLPDARFDRLVEIALEAEGRNWRERLPYRELEQEWLEPIALSGNAHELEVPTASIVTRSFDALTASSDDIYALTHTLMYLTDFGTRPWPASDLAQRLLGDLEAALAQTLLAEDYDTAGELLLGWPYLGASWSPIAAFGFRCLMDAEEQAGFLPGPSISITEYSALASDERTLFALASTYHTVFVMGLLASAVLVAGLPPKAIQLAEDWPGVDESLLAVEPLPSVHAARVYSELSRGERNSLIPMLLAWQLRSAISARRYGTVQRLLAVAREAGLPGTAGTRQTQELLTRLALLTEEHLVDDPEGGTGIPT